MASISDLFTAGQGFSEHFSQISHPIVGEYDLIGKYPDAQDTIRNVDPYRSVFEELRGNITPELELIESRVVTPVKELQTIMKGIRKNITKRDHKVWFHFTFISVATVFNDVYKSPFTAYWLR